MARRRGYLRAAFAAALLAGCDGSVGCVSCGGGFTYPDPPPAGGQVQRNTLISRLQENGVRFLATHLSEILRARFPTRSAGGIERAVIDVPEAQLGGGWALLVRDGCIGAIDPDLCPPRSAPDDMTLGPTHRSRIELNLDTIDQSVDVAFVPGAGPTPDAVRVTLYDVDLFADLGVVLALGGGVDIGCRVRDQDLDRPALHLERLRFTVSLAVDANNAFTGAVSGVEVEVGEFLSSDLLNVRVSPCNGGGCDDPACWDGWTEDLECQAGCAVGEALFTVAEIVADLFVPVIEWALPPVIEALAAAVLDEVNGAPLWAAGRYELAQIFGEEGRLAPLLRDPTAILFGAVPNQDAFRVDGPVDNRGISLVLDAAAAAEPSPCVPTVAVPAFGQQLGTPPFFDGTVSVGGRDEAYDLAVAISEAFTAQAAFAFYQLGGTCLALDAIDLERLSGGSVSLGALALLAPALGELGDPRAPLLFHVHPTAPPRVRFGTGATIGHDANGEPIVDSLLQLDLGEMGVSIFAFVDDGYVRLASVAADVDLGLPLVRTPRNTLELGIDRIAIENLLQFYNELLPEQDFGQLFEVLISVALAAAVTNVGSFDLDLAPIVSRMLGGAPVYARINAVQREGSAEAGFLVAYVTLCDSDDLQDPAKPPCYTPPPSAPAPGPSSPGAWAVESGRLRVPLPAEYAAQIRVDGTYWTGLRRPIAGVATFAHPLLGIAGVHRVELRHQLRDQYWTLSDPPIVVEVLVP